jgi:hypothetical protein
LYALTIGGIQVAQALDAPIPIRADRRRIESAQERAAYES